MIVNHKKYIEQLFEKPANFSQKASCHICKNGDGIDQIILKVELPNLPDGIQYKNDCVYDLLKTIELYIGGSYFLTYNSNELKQLRVISSYLNHKSNPRSNNKNIIYYAINLNEIFGESKIENKDENEDGIFDGIFDGMFDFSFKGINEIFGESKIENKDENEDEIFDLGFKGIRLCDLLHAKVTLYIDFNDIFSIIENTIESESPLHKQLERLQIINCSLLVNYTSSKTKIKLVEKNITKQKIKRWKIDDQHLYSFKDNKLNNVKLKMCWNPKGSVIDGHKIKKLIFECDQSNKLTSYKLQIDGYDLFPTIDLTSMNDMNALYEFNNNVILNKNTYAVDLDTMTLNSDSNVILCLGFNEPIDKLTINAFFEIEIESIYERGIFRF